MNNETLQGGEAPEAEPASEEVLAANEDTLDFGDAATDAGAEADAPADEAVSTLEEENANLKDQLLRALAETENVRRRAQRDREDAAKYGVTAMARDLLSVADNLRRALDSVSAEARKADTNLDSVVTGVEMVEKEFLSAFEKHHVARIDAAGEKFDHNRHQAMFEVETNEHPPGTVVQVLQVGYVLHDRLLRPAMVGVAKAPAGSDGDQPDAPEGGHVDTTA